MRDKVTRQCPQITTFEEVRTEVDWNRGSSAYQPNALPLGQIGSPVGDLFAFVKRIYLYLYTGDLGLQSHPHHGSGDGGKDAMSSSHDSTC